MNLPIEIVLNIFKYSTLQEITIVSQTNTYFYSIYKNNQDYIYRILVHQNYSNCDYNIEYTLFKRHLDNYKSRLKSKSQYNYIDAIQSKNITLIQFLDCIGIDINYINRNNDITFDFDLIDRPDLIEEILDENNVDIDIQKIYDNIPLMYSLRYSTPEIINKILDLNPDIHVKNFSSNTPLMYAFKFSTPEIIMRILDCDPDINVPNYNGDTPLMYALEYSTSQIANRILDNIQSQYLQRELIYALKYSTPEIINKILDLHIHANKYDNYAALDRALQFSTPEIIDRIRYNSSQTDVKFKVILDN